MRKRRYECSSDGCGEPPHLGGLCERHHLEFRERQDLREKAIRALHRLTVGEQYPENPVLRDELLKIHGWWNRACLSINHRMPDKVLLDEATYAVEWCISLAQEIVKAEEAFRVGRTAPDTLAYTQLWVWDRFINLQAGLMSNGVKRLPSEGILLIVSKRPARRRSRL